MTVIRPNSIAGINSITAQSNTIGFFKSDGTTLGVTLTGISFGDVPTLSVTGVATVSGGIQGIGIQSAGITITSGIITSLNFVGTGNTVQYNSSTKTVDISISGNLGAGGTFNANSVGVHTTKILGISTTNVTGAAKSEGAIQAFGNIALIDGALLINQTVGGEITIPAGRNGLLIGPVAISAGSTVTVQTGSTLVIV